MIFVLLFTTLIVNKDQIFSSAFQGEFFRPNHDDGSAVYRDRLKRSLTNYPTLVSQATRGKRSLLGLSFIPPHLRDYDFLDPLKPVEADPQNDDDLGDWFDFWSHNKRLKPAHSAFLYKRGRTHSRLLETEGGDPFKYMIFPKEVKVEPGSGLKTQDLRFKKPFCNGFYGCHNYPKKLTQHPRVSLRTDSAQPIYHSLKDFSDDDAGSKRLDDGELSGLKLLFNHKRSRRDNEEYFDYTYEPPANDALAYKGNNYAPALARAPPVGGGLNRRFKRPFCNSFTGCNNG